MADKQSQRIESIQSALGPKIPFIGNRNVRIASSVLLAILFIFMIGALGTTSVILGQLFWAPKEQDSFNIIKPNTKDYKQWKRAMESSLGLCGAIILVIVILLTLYFIFLKTDFEFSERMSTNLTIATQGANKVKEVAGLLTDYVYPKGSVPDEVRANLANQFVMRLREAYVNHNNIGQLSPEDYDDLTAGTLRKTAGFTPGGKTPTSEEYDIIRDEVQRRGGSTTAKNAVFDNLKNNYTTALNDAYSDASIRKMGQPTAEQRRNLFYQSTGIPSPQRIADDAAARETAAYTQKLNDLGMNRDLAVGELNQARNTHSNTMAQLARNKAIMEAYAQQKNNQAYVDAAAQVAGYTADSQETQEILNSAKEKATATQAAYENHLNQRQ